MRITDRKQPPGDGDRIVNRGALADPPIVDVAAEVARRRRIDNVRLARRQRDHTEMRPDWDPYIPEDSMVFHNEAVIDRNPWIVDDVVPDAEGIGLRHP